MKSWIKTLLLGLSLLTGIVSAADSPPPISNTSLLVWANEAVIKVYSYDFANFAAQLQGVSDYFTTDAWHAYTDAVSKAKTLDTVTSNKLTVSAVALKPPVIKEQKPIGANYQWKVEMPTLVNYESPNTTKQQKLMIELVISTVAAPQGVRGLAIQSFISKPMDEAPKIQ